MKLSYVPQVIHACCLGYKGFYSLIDLSMDDGWIFHQSVFFHPNVCTDGWDALIGMHSTESRVFDREKLKYDVKMVAMRHIDYEETRKDQLDQIRFGGDFPGFPALPKFWVEETVGSSVALWPPQLFWKWAVAVARGEALRLAPEHGEKPSGPPTAGPPPSPSPSFTLEHEKNPPHSPQAGPSTLKVTNICDEDDEESEYNQGGITDSMMASIPL